MQEAPHGGEAAGSTVQDTGAAPPRQETWRRLGMGLWTVLGFVLAVLWFPVRPLDRLLPLRGLLTVVTMLWMGLALIRHTQRWPPLEDSPYVVGAVVGFLLWPPLFWFVTNFHAKKATLADNLGVVMIVSVAGLPLLGAGLMSGANLMMDTGAPVESAVTLVEVHPSEPETPAGRQKISYKREGRKARPLQAEIETARFSSLEPGTALGLVTKPGFFGWEYRVDLRPPSAATPAGAP